MKLYKIIGANKLEFDRKTEQVDLITASDQLKKGLYTILLFQLSTIRDGDLRFDSKGVQLDAASGRETRSDVGDGGNVVGEPGAAAWGRVQPQRGRSEAG